MIFQGKLHELFKQRVIQSDVKFFEALQEYVIFDAGTVVISPHLEIDKVIACAIEHNKLEFLQQFYQIIRSNKNFSDQTLWPLYPPDRNFMELSTDIG